MAALMARFQPGTVPADERVGSPVAHPNRGKIQGKIGLISAAFAAAPQKAKDRDKTPRTSMSMKKSEKVLALAALLQQEGRWKYSYTL